MIDMGSIGAVMTSLKGAVEIAQGLAALKGGQELQEQAIRLQNIIIDVQQKVLGSQQQMQDLFDENSKLKAEIAIRDDLANNYEEVTPITGTHLYRRKGEGENSTKLLCARCFEVDHKPITLQCDNSVGKCPECKTTYRLKESSLQVSSFPRGGNNWMA